MRGGVLSGMSVRLPSKCFIDPAANLVIFLSGCDDEEALYALLQQTMHSCLLHPALHFPHAWHSTPFLQVPFPDLPPQGHPPSPSGRPRGRFPVSCSSMTRPEKPMAWAIDRR